LDRVVFASSVLRGRDGGNAVLLPDYNAVVVANGLEPYVYLRTVFTELPKAMMLDDIEALLPWTRHT
jgi:hypothetical protein